jgi:hypothetical protein
VPARTITWSATLTVVDCCNCGILFGVPQDLDKRNRANHRSTFWCPNGHEQHYSGPTEAQKLRDELARTERQRDCARASADAGWDQARAAERSASAYKGRVTRLKNRAAAGVCPCCTRSFENLHRHMESQHPDFGAADDA